MVSVGLAFEVWEEATDKCPAAFREEQASIHKVASSPWEKRAVTVLLLAKMHIIFEKQTFVS